MDDSDRDLILIFTFLGLTIVIGLLGLFLLSRLNLARVQGRSAAGPAPGCSPAMALLVVGLLILAFLSTFHPFLAVAPALAFGLLGFHALFSGGAFHRDGGIVLLLVSIEWALFTAIQAHTLASGADIRVDLLITLPVTAFTSSIGWMIFRALSVARTS